MNPTDTRPALALYGTEGCHLCEMAEAILNGMNAEASTRFTFTVHDIADDDALLQAYGVRIPVLRHLGTGQEAGWPFSREDVLLLLESHAIPAPGNLQSHPVS